MAWIIARRRRPVISRWGRRVTIARRGRTGREGVVAVRRRRIRIGRLWRTVIAVGPRVFFFFLVVFICIAAVIASIIDAVVVIAVGVTVILL